MVKDKRAKTVKILIETGNIQDFKGIFDHIPKTTVSTELGIHFTRMRKMVKNVSEIKVADIFLFSAYFEVDSNTLFVLILNQKDSKKVSLRSKKL